MFHCQMELLDLITSTWRGSCFDYKDFLVSNVSKPELASEIYALNGLTRTSGQ